MLKILSWLFMLEFSSLLIEMNFFQNNNFLDPLFLHIFHLGIAKSHRG
jgi:hypothetical protein